MALPFFPFAIFRLYRSHTLYHGVNGTFTASSLQSASMHRRTAEICFIGISLHLLATRIHARAHFSDYASNVIHVNQPRLFSQYAPCTADVLRYAAEHSGRSEKSKTAKCRCHRCVNITSETSNVAVYRFEVVLSFFFRIVQVSEEFTW